jgi:aminoglycoside phosphotransferase (APT) family kinase protein
MTLEALGSVLRGRFPELSVEPLRLLDVGFGSTVVETADGVVFRFARTARAAAAHGHEILLLRQLVGRLPAAVPDPRWQIEPDEEVPFGAVGYHKLRGEPLGSDGGGAALAADIAAFLRVLHALRDVEVRAADDERAALRDATLPVLRERLDRHEFARIERWWAEVLRDGALDRFDPALRHADLWYENLLVSGGRLVGVLDWSAAAIGDPAEDFAPLRHLGDAFAEAVLTAYGADDPLRHRARRHWELRELYGIRLALELGDEEELADSVAKLRAGPILRPQ